MMLYDLLYVKSEVNLSLTKKSELPTNIEKSVLNFLLMSKCQDLHKQWHKIRQQC